jgi:selenocysteine lyase/cysteine desulfurase
MGEQESRMTLRRNFLASLAAPLLARAQSLGSGAPGLPGADDPAYWAKVRDQFPLARDKVFFNNGTIGAMPKVVLDRTVEHLRKMATDVADWDYKPGDEWIAGYGPMLAIRTKTARLLNADVTEIALTENVTAAMSYVAAGLEVAAGSEILISDQEHPGGRSPWLNAAKRHGAGVQTVHIPKPAESAAEVMDVFRNALNARTRVLAISHVITGSGAILPVKEMCAEARARGIFTVIDGAQAVGQIPVDLGDMGCDAYVGCFHKWLLAPAGAGFLYLKKDRARAVWTTLASSQWSNHEDEGYRFTQRGTGSLSLLMGVDAALDFHASIGAARIHQRVKYLGDYLRDGLRKIPGARIYTPSAAAMCAGITVYGIEGVTGQRLQDEMWARARLRPRASGAIGVRHCTHIFNSPKEIDQALAVVRALAKG